MWKPVLGSELYEIDCKSGKVRITSTQQEVGTDDPLTATVRIEGWDLKVNRSWLKYMSYFEYDLDKALVLQTENNVRFDPVDARIVKLRYNVKIRFIEPVYVTKKHRLVPCYPNYAVDEYGEIIDITNGNNVVKYDTVGETQHPSVWIYDPDRGFKRSITVHRLVAGAWVENDDPFHKCIVNHLDGNKHNPHHTNLEWCTVSENNKHAAETGLTNIYLNSRIRDIETGKVHEFSRWVDLCAYVGIRPQKSFNLQQRHISIPYRGRYEIRIGSDDRDWYFEDKEVAEENGRYLVTVIDSNTDEKLEFRDTRTLTKHYQLWNAWSLKEKLQLLKKRSPHIAVSVIDTYNVGGIQSMDLLTGNVTDFESMRDASRKTGIMYSKIHTVINNGGYLAINGTAFRRESITPWKISDNKVMITSKRSIVATKDDGNIKEFASLREASTFFKVDRSVIKHRIRTATPLNNYMFKYASPLLSQGSSETSLIAGTH